MFVYFFFYVLLFSSCLSLSVSLSAHSLKLSSLCLTFSQAHSLKLSPLYFTAAGPTHCPTASLASWQRRNLTIKKKANSITLFFFSFPHLSSSLCKLPPSLEHERPINGSFIQHKIPKEIKPSTSLFSKSITQ